MGLCWVYDRGSTERSTASLALTGLNTTNFSKRMPQKAEFVHSKVLTSYLYVLGTVLGTLKYPRKTWLLSSKEF